MRENKKKTTSLTFLLPQQWKWLIVLSVFTITILVVIDIIAFMTGFSLRTSIEDISHFESFINYLNFMGIFPVLVFGDLLANSEASVHEWNLFLFFAGGVASWTVLAGIIGRYIDFKISTRIKKNKYVLR